MENPVFNYSPGLPGETTFSNIIYIAPNENTQAWPDSTATLLSIK